MGKEKIRWGLLGAGVIIDRWIKGAMQVEDMEIAAVASRTAESARHMAEKYGIPEVMSYGELLGRDDIDAVYVPVPHTAHKDLTIRALEAGKNVLVEKPAAVTAADFEEMAACAKKNGKFLMEAVWTRFFPLAGKLEEVLRGSLTRRGQAERFWTWVSMTCILPIWSSGDNRTRSPAWRPWIRTACI